MDGFTKWNSLIEVLNQRSLKTPNDTALIFLDSELNESSILTYSRLVNSAKSIAVELKKNKLRPGDRVLLVFAPGEEFVIGYLACLFAGAVAVPIYAPHPAQIKKSFERMLVIVKDCSPQFFLTNSKFSLALKAFALTIPSQWRTKVVNIDDVHVNECAGYVMPELAPDSVAFLQYTSGSTSRPKGVMVSHGNLVNNLEAIKKIAYIGDKTFGVSWLPPYHDMGLIGGILQPLYAGFPCAIMSPLDFLMRPSNWLIALSRYKANVSPLPNFALDLCVRKTPNELVETLDLSHWTVAINGAEPIRSQSIEKFNQKFARAGFRPEAHRPVYGLAESTLMSSCFYADRAPKEIAVNPEKIMFGEIEILPLGAPSSKTLIACGAAIDGHKICIVDPESRKMLPDFQIGEVWIQGPSVALGYWKNAELTEVMFNAKIEGAGDESFLRSGDLGFMKDGELYIAGRRKDLIILNGKNYYPVDVETVAESHGMVRPGSVAAFSVDREDEEKLIVVAEFDASRTNEQLEAPKLIQLIKQDIRKNVGVDAHEVVLIEKGSLPKTTSGKVQRFKAKEAYLTNKLKYVS